MEIQELLLFKNTVRRFNKEFIGELDHDWDYDIIPTKDSNGLRTYILKPYFNHRSEKCFKRTDGYTIDLLTNRITFHDSRTEWFFKANENELEKKLEQLIIITREKMHDEFK